MKSVWQNMAKNNAQFGNANTARRFDELARLERQRRGARDAGKDRRVDDADRRDAGPDAGTLDSDDEQREEEIVEDLLSWNPSGVIVTGFEHSLRSSRLHSAFPN